MFRARDRGSTFFRNVAKFQPYYTESHPEKNINLHTNIMKHNIYQASECNKSCVSSRHDRIILKWILKEYVSKKVNWIEVA